MGGFGVRISTGSYAPTSVKKSGRFMWQSPDARHFWGNFFKVCCQNPQNFSEDWSQKSFCAFALCRLQIALCLNGGLRESSTSAIANEKTAWCTKQISGSVTKSGRVTNLWRPYHCPSQTLHTSKNWWEFIWCNAMQYHYIIQIVRKLFDVTFSGVAASEL